MVDLLLTGDEPRSQEWLQRIPVGRMGTPDEIGGICVFLASEQAAYINGTTIWADGGGT
jgi:NAD(P)-dependent dehydrogenase (short-subunit alcohol dehydrogenase family)